MMRFAVIAGEIRMHETQELNGAVDACDGHRWMQTRTWMQCSVVEEKARRISIHCSGKEMKPPPGRAGLGRVDTHRSLNDPGLDKSYLGVPRWMQAVPGCRGCFAIAISCCLVPGRVDGRGRGTENRGLVVSCVVLDRGSEQGRAG